MIYKKRVVQFLTAVVSLLVCCGYVISLQWQFVDAGARGDLITLNKYLDWGINPNLKSTVGGMTALRFAVANQRWVAVRMLLTRGADPNTGLQTAITKGNLEIVKLLVEKGADVNAKRGFWYTPLQSAIATGNKDVVAYLRSKGAKE